MSSAMHAVGNLIPLLSLLLVAVHAVAASYAPAILYPNASSVWYKDYMHNVTWRVPLARRDGFRY